MNDKPIKVVVCDRFDTPADWALVSGDHVTLVRAGQEPEVLKGTALRRFQRWVLREPERKPRR